jgi:ribosomal protein L12E/L44/L45/RPP1/RPP2
MAFQSDDYIPTEEELDTLVIRAVAAALEGDSIEELLEALLSSVPMSVRETVRRKYAALLKAKGLRAPGKSEDIASRETVARIRALFALTSAQILARIQNLLRARPDIAATVREAGQTLLSHGVTVEEIVSESDLGVIAPATSLGKAAPRKEQTRENPAENERLSP